MGTRIYDRQTGDVRDRAGAGLRNIVLADEINRAPAKMQSALLEVMQERQVTDRAADVRSCPTPFLVLATQNPIEYEGTYPLPEAQLDRFMMKVLVGYPDGGRRDDGGAAIAFNRPPAVERVLPIEKLHAYQRLTRRCTWAGSVAEYAIRLAGVTRNPGEVWV